MEIRGEKAQDDCDRRSSRFATVRGTVNAELRLEEGDKTRKTTNSRMMHQIPAEVCRFSQDGGGSSSPHPDR